MLTVEQISNRYAVTETTVLGWIKSGELRAVNVGRSTKAKRPRWRISQAALEAFEMARTLAPKQIQERKPRRKKPTDVIEFYA